MEAYNKNIIRMSSLEAVEVRIYYDVYNTNAGKVLIASTDKGVCFIALGEDEFMFDELVREYPNANLIKQNSELHNLSLSYINSPAADVSVPFHIKGTDFQLRVWSELLNISPGEKRSYKKIAEDIGMPKAARAVGTAVGQNPISCLIPCHRVIRSDNTLGGYHWGLDVKNKLLDAESLYEV